MIKVITKGALEWGVRDPTILIHIFIVVEDKVSKKIVSNMPTN